MAGGAGGGGSEGQDGAEGAGGGAAVTADSVVPSLADILGKIDEEAEEEQRQVEAELNRPLALHVDSLQEGRGGQHSVEELLWAGRTDVARAVAVFGPGLVVLPLLGSVFGAGQGRCLAYGAHSGDKGSGSATADLEDRFGPVDPQRLLDELSTTERSLVRRLRGLESDAVRDETAALEDWHRRASGRMWTLKKRAAWAVLGIPHTNDQAAVKRAFKRKALELHPDKGGDADHFQLLQEMRAVLLAVDGEEPRARRGKQADAPGADGKPKKKEKKKGEDGKEAEEKDEGKEGEDDEDESDISDDERELREVTKKLWKDEDDEIYSWMDDSKKDRAKLEASRKRIHRACVELWGRAGKLAGDIERLSQAKASGDAVRALRSAIERFAASELAALRPGRADDAIELLELFARQGAEVLCTAGVVDPVTAVAEVAMKVNRPLLEAAPSSPELERRCAGLLEALQALPSAYERFVAPAEEKFAVNDQEVPSEEEDGAPARLRLQLLLPEPASGAGPAPPPGGAAVELEMPAGATVADLLARAAKMHEGPLRLRVKGGQLLAAGDTVLTNVEGLQDGAEVVIEPDTLDSEYPAWMTAAPRARPAPAADSALSLRRDDEASALAQASAAPTPAPKAKAAAHDFGCSCFKCIKRRQFRK